MNPSSVDPVAPPPLPPQPHRSSFSCDRHPEEKFSGFCPSCLCERLVTLDQTNSANNNNASSSSRRNSTSSSSAAAAMKFLFSKPSSSSSATFLPPKPNKNGAASSSFFPELRRSKSFSASKNEALGLSFEPQRRSCDVRVRNTLSALLASESGDPKTYTATSLPSLSQTHFPHSGSNGFGIAGGVVNRVVMESKEEEEDVESEEEEEEEEYEDCEKGEIGVDDIPPELQFQQARVSCYEIVEEEEEVKLSF